MRLTKEELFEKLSNGFTIKNKLEISINPNHYTDINKYIDAEQIIFLGLGDFIEYDNFLFEALSIEEAEELYEKLGEILDFLKKHQEPTIYVEGGRDGKS